MLHYLKIRNSELEIFPQQKKPKKKRKFCTNNIWTNNFFQTKRRQQKQQHPKKEFRYEIIEVMPQLPLIQAKRRYSKFFFLFKFNQA